MKNLKILKGAVVILTISILLFANLFVIAQTTNKKALTLEQELYTNYEAIFNSGSNGGLKPIIIEYFDENKTFHPDWKHNVTNSSATWQIEDNPARYYSEPNYAICYNSIDEQNEWLTTYSLDFSPFTEVKLTFMWMAEWWFASYKNLCDLNVCISTDGGTEWECIWSLDKYKDPSNYYEGYPTWHDTDMGKPIDLTDYASENDVKIGFQYYSADGSDGCQIFIEDIEIYGNDPSPNPVNCDAQGPYEGKAGKTIFFEAKASGGQPPYWYFWNFGDGSRRKIGFRQSHKYYEVQTYNVTLTVYDSKFERLDKDQTNVKIGIPDQGPPGLSIVNVTGGLGFKAEIFNDGDANVTNIEWWIHARGELFTIFDRKDNGTIDDLSKGESHEIRLKHFIGIGRIHIIISAKATELEASTRERSALKIGPLYLFVREK
jgi:hypothetical protein